MMKSQPPPGDRVPCAGKTKSLEGMASGEAPSVTPRLSPQDPTIHQ